MNVDSRRNKVLGHGRDSAAEVGEHAVAELQGGAPGDLLAFAWLIGRRSFDGGLN